MNAAGVKVTKAQLKDAAACLKAASKGEEADPQACLSADRNGKIAKVALKTVALEADKCAPPPPFAFSSASVVNATAQSVPLGLVADVFGADLNAVVAPGNPEGASCQAAVLKTSQKLFTTMAGSFLKCKKAMLAGKTTLAISGEQLAGCFSTVSADAKGGIAKAAAKMSDTLVAKCSTVDLPSTLAGACFATDDPTTCLVARAQCRLCELFTSIDDLPVDCDSLDDQQANGSCP